MSSLLPSSWGLRYTCVVKMRCAGVRSVVQVASCGKEQFWFRFRTRFERLVESGRCCGLHKAAWLFMRAASHLSVASLGR